MGEIVNVDWEKKIQMDLFIGDFIFYERAIELIDYSHGEVRRNFGVYNTCEKIS